MGLRVLDSIFCFRMCKVTCQPSREMEGHLPSPFLMLIASTSLIENEGGFLIPSARGNNIIVRGPQSDPTLMKTTRKRMRKRPPMSVACPSSPGSSRRRRNVLARGAHYESGVGEAPILVRRISDCEVLNSKISCRLLRHEAALLRKPFCSFGKIGSNSSELGPTTQRGSKSTELQRHARTLKVFRSLVFLRRVLSRNVSSI